MTPNTLDYMIAGYIVILSGIIGYVISIIIRSKKARQILDQRLGKTRQNND